MLFVIYFLFLVKYVYVFCKYNDKTNMLIKKAHFLRKFPQNLPFCVFAEMVFTVEDVFCLRLVFCGIKTNTEVETTSRKSDIRLWNFHTRSMIKYHCNTLLCLRTDTRSLVI